MAKNYIFKPRARLLLQLGDQLIRNESIALLEIIKNSYDADAEHIDIILSELESTENGLIVIEDDGFGMNLDIIETIWLEPGNNHKGIKLAKQERTPKGRLPLGEKGIGRFGVHKLGNEIKLITRMKNSKEVVIDINWTDFVDAKYLEDVNIKITERTPEHFKTGSGTRIEIRNLKKSWSRRSIRDVYRSVTSLQSPFKRLDKFEINFKIDNEEYLKGLLKWNDVKDYRLFEISCEMEGSLITKFDYSFIPWGTMNKLKKKTISLKDDLISNVKKIVDKENKIIDLNQYKIGKVKFNAYIYDRDSKILNLGLSDKSGLKKYLDDNGGIRMYRDGVRVYDYGEPGNDWLGLGMRRVNVPAKRVSNNIILGAINLERESSSDLIEKTNREGFIENEAYQKLLESVLYVIDKVEMLRKIDKDRLRHVYGLVGHSEPVLSTVIELKKTIDKKVKDSKLKEEINVYLKRIENDYKQISEIYIRSSSAGLTLSIVIHEVDKLIEELIQTVSREKPSQKIVNLVQHLAKLIEGYTMVIQKSKLKRENLTDLVNQAIFNVELRLKNHNVSVKFVKPDKLYPIKVMRNMVLGSILNILDNSIWWLDYSEQKDKQIFIDIIEDYEGFTGILISDNGLGFALSSEDMVKPFVSGKPDGMGLGLHIVESIMSSHNGKIIFPSYGDVKLPSKFEKGAKIILLFKNEE